MSAAILTTPSFDATTVVATTVCFGSATTPSARDCTETHGRGHPQDVDKDKDVDLQLHYETAQTGIAVGDTKACLTGTTASGVSVYGCDAIVTR